MDNKTSKTVTFKPLLSNYNYLAGSHFRVAFSFPSQRYGFHSSIQTHMLFLAHCFTKFQAGAKKQHSRKSDYAEFFRDYKSLFENA